MLVHDTHTHTHTHTHTQKNAGTTHTSPSCGLRQAKVPPLPGQGSPGDAQLPSWHCVSCIQCQWLGRTVAMAASDPACRQGQWLAFAELSDSLEGVVSCQGTGPPADQTFSWHGQPWPHPEPTSLPTLGTGRLSQPLTLGIPSEALVSSGWAWHLVGLSCMFLG